MNSLNNDPNYPRDLSAWIEETLSLRGPRGDIAGTLCIIYIWNVDVHTIVINLFLAQNINYIKNIIEQITWSNTRDLNVLETF